RGLIYATSAEAADVTVIGRWQAPRITESPAAQSVDEGEALTFSADAHAVPAASVAWESRAAGSTEWVAVDGADETTLEVLATADLDGVQYRAVFSNEIDGGRYSTRSATATLSVNSDGAPGGEPEEPAEPEEPTEPEEPSEPQEPGEPADLELG
ncbi:immunoglobulin domain-containing protein, partial [Georgenia sp. 10Sc9-8]|nr:immunoglobulin domain-containing protein [Georgenia halotolerans]